MIDDSEPKTRILSAGGKDPGVVLWTFTADDDLTLRAVYLNNGILSVDPNFTRPADYQMTDELRLDSSISAIWLDLCVPLPKGRKLFWGGLLSVSDSLITLVLT